MNTRKVVVIFDSDGVLIDTVELVELIAPWLASYRTKFPKFWDFIRKIIILFYADRVCDGRLFAPMGMGETIKLFDDKENKIEKYVVTKRPFLFGAKRRLMRQLDTVYGSGTFRPENVFSSFLSSNKANVVRKKIWQNNMIGVMIDDNPKNLENMPDGIIPAMFVGDVFGDGPMIIRMR